MTGPAAEICISLLLAHPVEKRISVKEKNSLLTNDFLEKCFNIVETFLTILNKFQRKKTAVIFDIQLRLPTNWP